jgi:hypothetical protein
MKRPKASSDGAEISLPSIRRRDAIESSERHRPRRSGDTAIYVFSSDLPIVLFFLAPLCLVVAIGVAWRSRARPIRAP